MSNKDLEGTFKLKPYRDKSQEKKVSPSWSSPFYSMLIMYTDNIYLTTYCILKQQHKYIVDNVWAEIWKSIG